MRKIIILFVIATMVCGCSYLKEVLKSEKIEKEQERIEREQKKAEKEQKKAEEEKAKIATAAVPPAVAPTETPAVPLTPAVVLPDSLMKVTVSNLPLRAVGDSIFVNYKIVFPEGSVSPNEKLIIMPVMTYADQRITGDKVVLQGEALNEENVVIVPKAGSSYKGHCAFYYAGVDPKMVKFHLVLQTINFKLTKFDAAEQNQKIDTIFATEGLSLLDRLLVVDEFVMMANLDSINSILQSATNRCYAMGDSSKVRIDSIVSVLRTNYTNAVMENNFGVVAMQNGNLNGARENFKKSMAMDSMLMAPRVNLSLIEIEQGNYEAARKNLRSGVLYNYINGNYSKAEEQLTGCNQALAEILLKRLNKAEEILEGVKGNRSDLMKLIIYAHRGETEKVDSILYKSASTFEGIKGYNIVKNEIEIYK